MSVTTLLLFCFPSHGQEEDTQVGKQQQAGKVARQPVWCPSEDLDNDATDSRSGKELNLFLLGLECTLLFLLHLLRC